MSEKFWNFAASEEDGRTLEIYGTIASESWFDDDVTPDQFRAELNSGVGNITVYINSPGGDCFAASQIYTMLREYRGIVTIKIDGVAASAASVIAMAGNVVLMAPTAMMMIHNPATVAFGDHNDMAKAIEMLDEVKESIINAYERKTGMQRAKIARLMEDETWMNARKALELGFADGIIGDETTAKAEAFAFSPRLVAVNLITKISDKVCPPTTEEAAPEETVESQDLTASNELAEDLRTETPKGRSVSDLLLELNEKS